MKCEIHEEEYCLTTYGNDPDKHVFLTESMLKVWASYIVSKKFLLSKFFMYKYFY
jgi:hypothetical protein